MRRAFDARRRRKPLIAIGEHMDVVTFIQAIFEQVIGGFASGFEYGSS